MNAPAPFARSPATPLRWLCTLRPGVLLSAAFLLLLCLMAAEPGWFTRIDPDEMDLELRLQGMGRHFWFGTDNHGRDIFTRVVFGRALPWSAPSRWC